MSILDAESQISLCRSLTVSLTFGRRVDPALLPSDDFDAAQRCECSPAIECRQWQPATSPNGSPKGKIRSPFIIMSPPAVPGAFAPVGHKFIWSVVTSVRFHRDWLCIKRFDSTRGSQWCSSCTPSMMPAAFDYWLQPKVNPPRWKRDTAGQSDVG